MMREHFEKFQNLTLLSKLSKMGVQPLILYKERVIKEE